MMANPVLGPALLESIQRAIVDDDRMWNYERVYVAERRSNGVCLPRGQRARTWAPDGPCGFDRIDCAHSTYVLRVPCTPRTFNEVMFQYPRFVWAQGKLRTLLAMPPPGAYPTRATAGAYARWCWDVMQLVSVAYWSTNIRDQPAGNLGVGGFDRTPYLQRVRGRNLDEFWARVSLVRARYGAHGVREPRNPITERNWNDVANASGWVDAEGRVTYRAGSDGARLAPARLPSGRASFDPVVGEWPLSWMRELGSRPDSLGYPRPYYSEPAPTSDFGRLVKLFEYGGERELLVPVTWAGARTPETGTYLSAEGTYLFCRALAQDFVATTFASFVATGLRRWNEALLRLPFDYRANLLGGLENEQAFGQMMAESSADAVFAGIQTGLGLAAVVVQAIPAVGQIVGAAIAVVQALLLGLNEILKATDSYATGAGAIPPCPPVPVIRVVDGGQTCNFDLREGAGLPGTTPDPTRPLRVVLAPLHVVLSPPPEGPKKSGAGAVFGAAALVGLALTFLRK